MHTPLRAILVGCGGISQTWLGACATIRDLNIVGLVDLDVSAARRRAEQFGLREAATGDDLAALIDRLAPDVVFDCTVPEAHHGVALTALGRGCHVLGEKPLAATLAQAREIVAAAQAAGRHHAVIQNRRYDPYIRRLRALIASGAIGPLTTLHSDFFIGAHFGGFRDQMRHVLLLDMAIHTFDAARLLSGADPVSVVCHEWNPPGSWYAHGASAVAIFTMSDGIVYTYRGSWCAEGLPTTWEADWRIIGQGGTARWDGATQIQAQAVAASGGFHSTMHDLPIPSLDPALPVGGHAGIIREFVRCVRSGATPETHAADNLKSLAMVLGAIESAERGETVWFTKDANVGRKPET